MKKIEYFSENTLFNRFGNNDTAKVIQDDTSKPSYKSIIKSVKNLSSIVEVLAGLWCVDNIIPLKNHSMAEEAEVIFYEDLLLNPEKEIDLIANKINISSTDLKNKMLTSANLESRSVFSGKVYEKEYQLSKWRDNLSGNQQEDVLKTVEDFGLDYMYDYNLTPKIG